MEFLYLIFSIEVNSIIGFPKHAKSTQQSETKDRPKSLIEANSKGNFLVMLKYFEFTLIPKKLDHSSLVYALSFGCAFIRRCHSFDSIKNLPSVERKNTIIGGNLRRWYGGFNSLIVAQEFNESIWAPQMGRMREDEKQLEDLNHLPYMEWVDWMHSLNKFKYAVHLNPNSIGGTFSLNCAYLGLPCIGNIHSNTQRLCFPDLSLEPDNLKDAKKLAKKLRIDKDFYLHCSNTAKELYQEYFSEKVYLRIWDSIIKEEFNEN